MPVLTWYSEFDFEKDLSVAMSPKELEYKQFRVFTVCKRTGLPFHSWRFGKYFMLLCVWYFYYEVNEFHYAITKNQEPPSSILISNTLSIVLYWCAFPCSSLGILCCLWRITKIKGEFTPILLCMIILVTAGEIWNSNINKEDNLHQVHEIQKEKAIKVRNSFIS